MIVPCLRSHLYGHQQAEHAHHGSHDGAVDLGVFLDEVVDGSHAEATPDGVGVEGTGIGIVALTRLHRRLVQIDHDGKSRHEEEEEHHPELLDAALSAIGLPEQSNDTEQQRQTVEHVVALIFLKFIGEQALVAQSCIIDEGDTRDPVAVLQFAIALDVVLTSGKVPHEVAPVHEVALIAEEEENVLQLRRCAHHDGLTATVVGFLRAFHDPCRSSLHPTLVGGGVGSVVHAWEEHILGILVGVLVAHDEVGVLLVRRGLFLLLIDGSALLHARLAILSIHIEGHLRSVGLSVEQRTIAILVAAEIGPQREDILRRVLVHRGIGSRADHDDRIRGVADHEHQHAEQGRVLHASADELYLFLRARLALKDEPQGNEHDDTDNHGRPSVAIEGNAQHGYRSQEGNVLADYALVLISLIDSPQDDGHQRYDIDDETRIEGHAQRVDEEQLEPSAHGDDAWHHAIEDGSHEHERHEEGDERTFQVGIGMAAVVPHQDDGRHAEQIEQVNADGETRDIGDEHQPAVAVGLVGMVFPLQYQPEHDGGEGRRIGIYLAFYGRVPEGVAKRIDQRAHQSGSLDGDEFLHRHLAPVFQDEFPREVCDGPEEEHDTRGGEQRAHGVDHACHLRRVAHELRQQVGREHEERCSRWVSYFQLVSGDDKLRTVPEGGCRLNSAAINEGCNEESHPAQDIVH